MKIAVPLDQRNFRERSRKALELGAQLIEIRVDLFENRDPGFILECVETVKSYGGELILTVRSPSEGGRPVPERLEIFKKVSPHCEYTDLELSSRDFIGPVKESVSKGKGNLILSFHDFERTPPAWMIKEIIREGMRFGAIPKVAVMANTYSDVHRLLCAGGEIQGEKILIAMGEVGRISRLAGFLAGSVITYCALDEAVAPGQISVEEMVKLRELFLK